MATKINRFEATPLYLQLKEIIKSKIESSEWGANYVIPGELKLAKTYKLSRVTVRQAIKELVDENYLRRQKGFGTYVFKDLDRQSAEFTYTQSFSNEMLERNYAKLSTTEIELKIVDKDDAIYEIFKKDNSNKIYNLIRIRASGDKRIVLSNTYILGKVDLDVADLNDSLYKVLIDKGILFGNFDEMISAQKVDEHISKKLNLESDFSLVRIRYGYDLDGDLFEYTINYYNPKYYKYHVNVLSTRKGD